MLPLEEHFFWKKYFDGIAFDSGFELQILIIL